MNISTPISEPISFFDDDIKFNEEIAEDGTIIDPGIARIQFKQLLGVGLLYSF